MGQLMERMRADMVRANYELRAVHQVTYFADCRRFAAHYMRSPAVMGRVEIQGYLDLLAVQGKPSALKGMVASLKYLYTYTLQRPEVDPTARLMTLGGGLYREAGKTLNVPPDVPGATANTGDEAVDTGTEEHAQLSGNSAESACPLGLLGYAR